MHFVTTTYKKALVKFIFSLWDEEKYVIILQKELRVNCKGICFLYGIVKSDKKCQLLQTMLWLGQETLTS